MPVQTRRFFDITHPSFRLRLDTKDGLCAVSWQNRLTGRSLPLGRGLEFECDLDAAEQRIPITGWKARDTQAGKCAPDAERGYREELFHPDVDDSRWNGLLSPSARWHLPQPHYTWVRTHVFVPESARGQKIVLVLGGFGIFDYRFMRVFVNGHAIGVRRANARWNEPKAFPLRQYVRLGQDNVIALQLCDCMDRTRELDAIDPHQSRRLPYPPQWPAQFEQYVIVGEPLRKTAWSVERSRAGGGKVVFDLAERKCSLTARVTYRWATKEATLHKFVTITNASRKPVRVMNVRLGSYETGVSVSDGEQGFPVYVAGEMFATLAHPSGWATGQRGVVQLRQYPGTMLAPGARLDCMETVLGVAPRGEAQRAFRAHVRARSRRAVRGHDRPYSILEVFGSWPMAGAEFFNLEPVEAHVLKHLSRVARAQHEHGCHFDLYGIEFWHDARGDLSHPHPKRFPRGFRPIAAALRKPNTKLGLWIDSSWTIWNIGENPVVAPSFNFDAAYGTDRPALCRASEPIQTMMANGLRTHMRESGARLFKFDNFQAICHNPHHNHLGGIYSTEAIQSGVIETMRALDDESRDVFLMLYWGYRSPWWLLHADTLFEPGIDIEAATPGDEPAMYVRDSITQGLDQAHQFCADVPWLGKDSLGVWLSKWGWNSSVGKERWQEGFVMDMCRGSLLAQPWDGEVPMTSTEWRQMAKFIALLKAQPACFANPRLILGNPWHGEPYGYRCSDGKRTFFALNNCSWSDAAIPLDLDEDWDLYRWYPNPVQLVGDIRTIALRPFDVVLLEAMPAGSSPSLPREFRAVVATERFAESSRAVRLNVSRGSRLLPLPADKDKPPPPPKRALQVRGALPASCHGGTLVVAAKLQCGGRAVPTGNIGRFFAATSRSGRWEPVVRELSYPSTWQAWRMNVAASAAGGEFTCDITARVPTGVKLHCTGHFVPNNPRREETQDA